jgi:hypothetical protein
MEFVRQFLGLSERQRVHSEIIREKLAENPEKYRPNWTARVRTAEEGRGKKIWEATTQA